MINHGGDCASQWLTVAQAQSPHSGSRMPHSGSRVPLQWTLLHSMPRGTIKCHNGAKPIKIIVVLSQIRIL